VFAEGEKGGTPWSRAPITRLHIDLNADVGEGYGNWEVAEREEELIANLTSASIACGAHAGDPTRARRACAAAAQHDVHVGAHIGYPDLLGFGRQALDMDPQALTDAVVFQIGALVACARAVGTAVRYVKPHGALYHACSRNEHVATAVLDGIEAVKLQLPILCAPGAVVEQLAVERGVGVFVEGFADRRYGPGGSLVPRHEADSLVTGDKAVDQGVRIALGRPVDAAGGQIRLRPADSICIHGDQPEAWRLAGRLRESLEAARVLLRPFTSSD
jgi:5-oxoprolinase (ATP-hydrolysing) subunit A